MIVDGVVFAGIAPHPPLLVPEVGRGDLREVVKTAGALRELGHRIFTSEAELLIIITPHGTMFRDAVAVEGNKTVEGDFGRFGAASVKLSFRTDGELCSYLEAEAGKEGVPVKILKDGYKSELDHGASVPLYYFKNQGVDLPGLHITYGLLSHDKLYAFGKAIRRAVVRRGLKTALIASGDLSHRLSPGAPAGFDPRGAEFDEKLMKLLAEYRVEEILDMDESLVEAAGECGLRSIIIALGFLFGLKVKPEILSYEAPFGVGYLVASFNIDSSSFDFHNAIPGLARSTIEKYLSGEKTATPGDAIPEINELKGGVFVSLKKRGQLRGCIGTVEPVYGSLVEEIANNAISAGFKDPRFPPLKPGELEEIDLSVDVLSPPEPVNDLSELDPCKYGIVVQSGRRSGLLLPDLEGVDTVEEQLNIALKKAGILPGKQYEVYKFTVTRYGDDQVDAK